MSFSSDCAHPIRTVVSFFISLIARRQRQKCLQKFRQKAKGEQVNENRGEGPKQKTMAGEHSNLRLKRSMRTRDEDELTFQ